MFSLKPFYIFLFVVVLLSACSDDSPAPAAQTKPLTEIEKIVCGSTSKTWRLTAINKGTSNVLKSCAYNDNWIFYYNRTLQIKNIEEECEGDDLYKKYAWNISADQNSIFMSTSVFKIVSMTMFEMRLQEESVGDPIFVFKR